MRKRRKKFFSGKNASRVMLQTSDLMPKKSRGFTILLILASAIIALSGAYLVFFSSYLVVNSISVAGTERIDQKALIQSVESVLQEPSQGFGRKNNILFIPENQIVNTIKQQFYGIDSVRVERILPNALKLTIVERLPVVVWQQNNTRYYVDRKGTVIQRVSLEAQGVQIPLITNTIAAGKLPEPGDYVIHPDAIEHILTTKNILQQKIGVDAKTFTMPTGFAEEFSVQTSEGWNIIFDRKRSVQSQLDALALMLSGTLKEKRPFLHYVDLRIKDVGYFQ